MCWARAIWWEPQPGRLPLTRPMRCCWAAQASKSVLTQQQLLRSFPRVSRLPVVVGVEEPLPSTDPHGRVRVQQQPGEAGGEVLNKVIRNSPQRLLDVCWQLVVVVLLHIKQQEDGFTPGPSLGAPACSREEGWGQYLVSHGPQEVAHGAALVRTELPQVWKQQETE